MTTPPTEFVDAVIRGGPHDGQSFQCPHDQHTVTFYEDSQPHQYYRLNRRMEFYSPEHAQLKAWQKRGRR